MDAPPQLSPSSILEISRRAPASRIVLWVHSVNVQLAHGLKEAGIAGILRKQLSGELIIRCLNKVAAGELWFERAVIPHPDAFARNSRMYVHGFLTPSGQFRALRPVRSEDAEVVPQLIPYLKKWEFRPATRDGKPVEVELLLVIPAAGS